MTGACGDGQREHHFIKHLLKHGTGIDRNRLVDDVAHDARAAEHRHLLQRWVDALVQTGHMIRGGNWVNLSEHGRVEAFRIAQMDTATGVHDWPF